MNVEEHLLILSKLAQADMRIVELQETLRDGPRELEQASDKVARARAAVEEAERQRETHDQARLEAERELATTDRRLEQSRENAKRVTTIEQAEASQVEIQSLRNRKADLEDTVLTEMEQVEEIAATIPALKGKAEEVDRERSRIQESVPALMEAAQHELEERRAVRVGLHSQLDAQYRRQYDTALSRGGNPLTTVVDRICQTCQTMVPAQYVVETHQAKTIHVCAGCRRVISKVIDS